MFGNNFVATTKDKNPFGKEELEDVINRYVEPYKPTDTKPKTEKEQAKADAEKAKLEQEIRDLRKNENVKKILQQTVSIEDAQSKIKSFLAS